MGATVCLLMRTADSASDCRAGDVDCCSWRSLRRCANTGIVWVNHPEKGRLGSIATAADGEEAMTTDDLMQQIAETERLIAVYRNANEVIVGTQDEIYSRRGLINRTTLSAAEIGDQIVRILQRRVEANASRAPEARRRISRGKPLIMPAG
jgi:hypothetical protein